MAFNDWFRLCKQESESKSGKIFSTVQFFSITKGHFETIAAQFQMKFYNSFDLQNRLVSNDSSVHTLYMSNRLKLNLLLAVFANKI